MIRRLISVFFLFISFFVLSQTPKYTAFNTLSGLPTNTIYGAMEDHEGYLWLSSETGAYRFDGYTFEQWSTAEGVPDYEVFRTFQDQKKRIWFYCSNGIPSYWLNDTVYTPDNDSLLSEFAGRSNIQCMLEDSLGNLWFGLGNDKILKLNEQGEYTWFWPAKADHEDHSSNFLGLDKSGRVIALTRFGVYYPEDNVFYPFPSSVSRLRVFHACQHNGQLYITNSRQIIKFDDEDYEVVDIDYTNFCIWLSAEHSNLVLGDHEGMLEFSIKDLFNHDKVSINRKLNGIALTGIYNDHYGNTWLTTHNKGLLLLENDSIFRYKESDGLQYERVRSLSVIDRALYIGYDGGKCDKWPGLERLNVIKGLDRVARNGINQIHQDQYGNQWLVSENALCILRKGEAHYQCFSVDVVCVVEDESNHKLWVVGTKSVRGLSLNTSNQMNFNEIELKNDRVFTPNHKIKCAYYDAYSNTLFLGTNKGVLAFKEGMFFETQLRETNIVSIQKGNRGTIIVLSDTEGVYTLKASIPYKVVYHSNAFANSIYTDMIPHSANGFWVSSQTGLYLCAYPSSDSSYWTLVKPNIFIRDIESLNNHVYAATDNGLFQIPKSLGIITNRTQKICLKNILINGEKLNVRDSYDVLHTNEADIELELGFIYPAQKAEELIYSWQLNDGRWVKSSQRILNIKLPLGSHTLRLKVSSINNKMRSKVKTVHFNVGHKFTAELKGWIVASIILISGVFLVFNRKKRSAQFSNKEENKEEFIDEYEEQISLKVGKEIIDIKANDIIYIRAARDYMEVHLKDRKILVHSTLKKLESILPGDLFLRVHRSYIVQLDAIVSCTKGEIFLPNKTIKIGMTYLNDIREKLSDKQQ